MSLARHDRRALGWALALAGFVFGPQIGTTGLVELALGFSLILS